MRTTILSSQHLYKISHIKFYDQAFYSLGCFASSASPKIFITLLYKDVENLYEVLIKHIKIIYIFYHIINHSYYKNNKSIKQYKAIIVVIIDK